MRIRTRRAAAAGLVLLFGSAASSSQPSEPQYTDAIGDANGMWGYDGFYDDGTNDGTDLRPLSVDSADVVSARLSTSYDSVRRTADDGRVVAVEHVPTGLRLTVETVAPASPTFGPTLAFDFYGVLANDCYIGLSIVLHGPATGPDDPAERGRLYRNGAGCAGGFRAIEVDEVTVEGNTMSATFPFTATLVDGVQLVPLGATITGDADYVGGEVTVIRRHPNGTTYGYKTVDTVDIPTAYTIGEDVPADVDCVTAPTDACA